MGDGPSARGLLLGRALAPSKAPMGFAGRTEDAAPAGLIEDRSDGHLLVVSPTSGGKGRNVIIPNLLTYEGPVVVVDPKGEALAVTGRRRRELGHRVIGLAPFAAQPGGSFNVFDILDPESPEFESDCVMLSRMISGGQTSLSDRFWDQTAEAILAGAIAFIATERPPEQRNLCYLRTFFCDPDLSYAIALALDGPLSGKTGLACDEFRNFLGHEGEKVRTSVRSTVTQHLAIFAGPQIAAAVCTSSFELNDITLSAAISLYIVIPPHKLEAFGSLLRLWIGALMVLVSRRAQTPDLPTLFVLDELAQLGPFPLLRPAVTLMRSYGLRCLLVLQDLAQLRTLFPTDHATISNNSSTLLTFGHSAYAMSAEMAAMLGDVGADALFDMDRSSLAMRRQGRRTEIAVKLDYLTDPLFAGQFDVNPLAPARSPALTR